VNIISSPVFQPLFASLRNDVKQVLAIALENDIPVAALSSALHYFDAITSEKLSANLIQAQRDFFGAHTYERIDKPGVFHTEWEG
jgi:6-phosphogluconate dehydrogenase